MKRVIAAIAIAGGALGLFGAAAPRADAQTLCLGVYVTVFGDQIIAERLCV